MGGSGEIGGAFGRLTSELDEALDRCLPDAEPSTLLFSGGVDSSLLAARLRSRPGLELLAVGLPGSRDLGWAEEAAGLLGLPVRVELLTPEEVGRARGTHARELAGLREPARSVALTTAVALARARHRLVVMGQGADELFLGYARYRALEEREARAAAARDLDRLVGVDWPRTVRIAGALGRAAVAPYLDPRFRAVAAEAVSRWPHSRTEAKPLLRAWAASEGLPGAIAGRAKSAMQYGTRVRGLLRRLDRAEALSRG